MGLRHICYFFAAAEELNITRSTPLGHCATSQLTLQITALEHGLWVSQAA
jgi:hypothetical protein